MVTVDIFGGLGNQMFQYALGRHLSIRNGVPLAIRHINVEAFSAREYELGCFKLTSGVRVVEGSSHSKFVQILRLGDRLRRLFPKDSGLLIQEKGFAFDPSILELTAKSIHLAGYWQSEKYFKGIRETILEDFTPAHSLSGHNQEIAEEIQNSNSVGVHVRRGDYVVDRKTNEYHGVCGPDYYRRAVEIIAKKVSEPVFYFFSDDMGWVKKNLKTRFKNVYVDWNTDDHSYVDMVLMSHCKHNILANSSFSWWGAWLNRNKDKIVVAPKKWFQDPSVDTRDLIPGGWIKV